MEACILSVVTSLCGRVAEGFSNSVQTQAEGGFSSLGGLLGKALLDCFEKGQNKVEREPTEVAKIIGADETLQAVRRQINGNKVDVVGLVGMGGVGKTTLLKKINNDLYSRGTRRFDIVIFVTVSSEGDALKVQKKIAERLRLPPIAEADFSQSIYDSLSRKRYLLLLDDVWGELDLKMIGVPFPNKLNRCKIALTTRSPDVFQDFVGTWCWPRERAPVVDVSKLDEARSWELFRGTVDPAVDLDDPSFTPHAETMVQKCHGLPLALVTMGRAMARATAPAEWRKARRQLEESPYRLRGMDDVQSNLMFTVDRLEKGTLLLCFLYCSLFPEDFNISEEHLIELWLGKGFLDNDGVPRRWGEGVQSTIHCARDEGEIVIQKLKDLCLLETGKSRSVKMHDLIRELALRLGSSEPNHFLVHAYHKLSFHKPSSHPSDIAIDVDEWQKATTISLVSCVIGGSLPVMPSCPMLSTLLMYDIRLSSGIPNGFFTTMPNLVVLKLAWVSHFSTIPTSICLLPELRYLSLRATNIRSLPEELGNLTRLKQLDLSMTTVLEEIPKKAIWRLSNLQVLDIRDSGYTWRHEGSNDTNQLRVGDLHGLEQLEDLGVDASSFEFLFNELLVSRGRPLPITKLCLVSMSDLTTSSLQLALESMASLRALEISGCENLSGELVLDCAAHTLVLCELQTLELWNVPLSAVVVSGGEEEYPGSYGVGTRRQRRGSPLQKLRHLTLFDMPKLEKLCDVPNRLRSLEELSVRGCPLLKTFPLGPRSKIREIRCDRSWWEGLQWRGDERDVRRAAELALEFF